MASNCPFGIGVYLILLHLLAIANPSLLGWAPRVEANATRVEAIALRLEAIAKYRLNCFLVIEVVFRHLLLHLLATAIRLEAVAIRLRIVLLA